MTKGSKSYAFCSVFLQRTLTSFIFLFTFLSTSQSCARRQFGLDLLLLNDCYQMAFIRCPIHSSKLASITHLSDEKLLGTRYYLPPPVHSATMP